MDEKDKKPIEKKLEKNEIPKKEKIVEVSEKKKEDILENKKVEKKVEEKKNENPIEKELEKKENKKVKKEEKPKIKKTEAIVNAKSLPISTKYSKEICRYIKNKKIEEAIFELEQVSLKKKAIPMRGEYGHKKGKRMAGGRYPKSASKQFITLLKSLNANSLANGLEEPFIYEAIANLAPRQMAKFGRWQRKRTHIKIVAKDKIKKNPKKKKEIKK